MLLLTKNKFPALLIGTLVLMLGVFVSPSASAQSCPAADADDGSSDGIITLNSGAPTTWTDTDGTAFDCATLSITVTNSTILIIDQDPTNGYAGQINAINVTVDSGSEINADAQGCIEETSPNSSNVCSDGGAGAGVGQGVGENGGSTGASHSGLGGESSIGSDVINTYYDDALNPHLFGSGGGTTNGRLGGDGGGFLTLNLSGDLTNNGTISVDGEIGASSGGGGAGGGSGGSLYVTVGGDWSGTGTFSAQGGAGGAGTWSGGGAGGGLIYIAYATTSIASLSTNVPSYVDASGGAAGGASDPGTAGNSVIKNTTTNTVYFAEGVGKVTSDTSACPANTCSMGGLEVWGTAEGQFDGDESTGAYNTISVSGDVTIIASGVLGADGGGCTATSGPNLSTNACENGTYDGVDHTNRGAGGGGLSGVGGAGASGAAGGTYALEDVLAPTLFGSGGGNTTSTVGGSGGGVLRLNITGDLTLGGTIQSNGGVGTTSSGVGAGGGSGGSIYVTVGDTWSGSGTLAAGGGDGGNGSTYDGGGGGGGFVYLEYDNTAIGSGTFASLVSAAGGAGNAGTDGTAGSSIINNTNSGLVYVTEGTSRFIEDSTVCAANLCSFTDMQILTGSSFHVVATPASSGAYSTLYYTGDLTVDSGGSLESDEGGCAESTSANAATNVCADGGSSEGVDDAGAGGGAHGGVGGDGVAGLGGTTTYGSSTAPVFFGSGGGIGSTTGGAGGGVLRIIVEGTLTQNGTISSDGGVGLANSGGGGAGGSIYINAVTLDGSSTSVFARGGAGNGLAGAGGGGGGGRVCVEYDTDSSAWLGSLSAGTNAAGGAAGGVGAAAGATGTLATTTCDPLNEPAVVSAVTAVQRIDGSKKVDISFEIDDEDDDNGMVASVAISQDGGGAFGTDPTLETPGQDDGTVVVTNGNANQLSGIDSLAGSNTITVVWDGGGDLSSGAESDFQVRILANDGTEESIAVDSSNFSVRFSDPTAPTLSYEAATDAETVDITVTGEEGVSVYVGGVDTGNDISGGTYTHTVTLAGGVGTNTYSFSFVENTYGNTSTVTTATIERTAGGGGHGSTSESSSEETTTEEETPDDEETTTEEEIPDEETTDEDTTTEEETAEDTDDFSMAGDAEAEDIDSPEDGNGTGSLAGEVETQQGNGSLEPTQPSTPVDEGTGGGSVSPPPPAAPPTTPTIDAEEVALIEYKESEKRRQIQRVRVFFSDESTWGESNDYGVPIAFVDNLMTDLGPSYDADFDGYTDYEELLLGSDPYLNEGDMIRLSQPFRDISESELDAITKEYLDETGLTAEELRVIDSDGDGLSDRHEILLGTDPQKGDSDKDGIGDGIELMFFGTNPVSENGLPEGVGITNVFGQTTSSEGSQLISGYAEPDALIRVYELSEAGERLVGRSTADEEGKFVVYTEYFDEGKYTFIVTSQASGKKGAVQISNVVDMTIRNDALSVIRPEHDPEVLEYGDNVEVSQTLLGLMPDLEQFLEREIVIMVTWESTIFGQTIIADVFNQEGTILFPPPGSLELGKHDVSWYAMDVINQLHSPAGDLNFTIIPTAFVLTEGRKGLNLIPVIIGGVVLLSGLVYYRRKKNPVKPIKGKKVKSKK